ncbi:M18 family aminopeptidase [Clostridium botulinum]|uniref:M18 family aminopeptidase n=1 Tax=Clostridium botulinum TaxID=1491 RepID=A0A846J737_CLOBO|nr:M18 family aminopeptidase [Clostridium botulinum]ACA56125.1 zinc metalloprotease, aminopeptidase I family [Clostridium botulinum A3 str. Loch Maree]NFH65219.1 M18 family aminopeptidase [Clostridium botulinum]NFJ09000.1 M18 family aminopeptidase [Clostridium botulinum]NFK16268.1 M18 family aminopeptidase [Clostridium botulinum]NFM92431.1 M18 family aminopeptidase [Clostridium botulinum]
MDKIKISNELIDFIYDSPSPYHVVHNLKNVLTKGGFTEIKESEAWKLKKGGKYFTTKNHSAIIAFFIGEDEIETSGFRIVASHTDSPTFKVKPAPEIFAEGNYIKLNTEVYGGPILNTWMDRPLSLAGRVVLKGKNPLKPKIKLINIKRPILIIPNLAIHMNRNVNKGVELNKQKDMLPIISMVKDKLEKENYLANIICKELDVNIDEILDFELFLYEFEKGCLIGDKNEFISIGKLDDLSMVHASLKALLSSTNNKSTKVMVCFDNEEVGSATKQGADSPFLSQTLERITLCLNKNKEEYFRTLSKSFMISCDSAHAIHPNVGEKSDPTNKVIMNNGPVIKISASQSYTSDAYSSSVYEEICHRGKVPVQKFVNRSDERGGSTIGPISGTHISIPSVDIGTALLAMHSIRELGGVEDQVYAIKSFVEFFNI